MRSPYILLLFNLLVSSTAFIFSPRVKNNQLQRLFASKTSREDEIRSMRPRAIKDELERLGISTVGLFEKEDLVARLVESRGQNAKPKEPAPKASSNTTNGKPKEGSPKASSNTLSAPLYFTNLDANLRIAAVNVDGGITVNPHEKPYVTIKIDVQDGSGDFSLQLLLDTACSGFVLRPSVVDKYNLPKMSNPVTMTGKSAEIFMPFMISHQFSFS